GADSGSRTGAALRARLRSRLAQHLHIGDAMRVRATVLCVTPAMIDASGRASGQWLHYPTPDVPRTADGKPNLLAPAPRLPDGKPDLSGIWQSARKLACTKEM